MEGLHGEAGSNRQIAGFWRRLGALVVDTILLGIVGWILGALFFDPLARMGAYAKLIGFAIALAYFGISNSRMGGGQTLGKRWLGVRVVDGRDQLLSSCVRADPSRVVMTWAESTGGICEMLLQLAAEDSI